MKNPRTLALHDVGQSLWLDNITRELLQSGTLARYIRELSVTGLTSNPTIFEHAIATGTLYDESIRVLTAAGLSGEALFFELALEDLTQAADLFRPIFEASEGADGWVSLEVSPLLAHDATGTIRAAARLHSQAACANLLIKIPGTPEGILAIEESIFAGIAVNVTLLFSCDHYLAAAQAYMRGLERRATLSLDLKVGSVASLFVSRWDVAADESIVGPFRNRLGIAIATRAYKAYRELLLSDRWKKLEAAGALPQRLLWASTGTKDPAAPDTLYVEALGAEGTIDTIPEKTLLAFADHGQLSNPLLTETSYGEDIIARFRHEGLDDNALAARLQREGVSSFAKSWRTLLAGIGEKSRSGRLGGLRMSAAVAITAAHPIGDLLSRGTWKALLEHHAHVGGQHMRELFAADPERGTRFTLEAAGLYLDYSKNRINAETLRLLVALALDCGLPERTAAMFRGDLINRSEQRAALHTALRAPASERIILDGVNIITQVHAALDRMAELAEESSRRPMARPHGQTHPQHRQHRHRGLRLGACDGL
jgi:transaldolase